MVMALFENIFFIFVTENHVLLGLLSPTVHYKFLTLTDAPKWEWRKTYTCSKE